MRILILEDDPAMAACFRFNLAALAPDLDIATCSDAVAAISDLSAALPDLILLDVLLPGPDGFTFLNELASYSDTAAIPVILISSLDLRTQDLSHYGVRAIFSKDTLTPATLQRTARELLHLPPTPTPSNAPTSAAQPATTPSPEAATTPSPEAAAAPSPEAAHA